jgi:hypothetical protein
MSWSLYLDLPAAKLRFLAAVRHLFPNLSRCVSWGWSSGIKPLYK